MVNIAKTPSRASAPRPDLRMRSMFPFHDIDRLFDTVFGTSLARPMTDLELLATPALFPPMGFAALDLGRPNALLGGDLIPSIEVRETDQMLEITAELPGLKQEDIEVSLTGDILTLKGEKKVERDEDKGATHLSERRYGTFQRSFRLPETVAKDGIEAQCENGVLRLTLPKIALPDAAARKIEVSGTERVEAAPIADPPKQTEESA
jgi:HSP20 family molecular chaperone IbpA